MTFFKYCNETATYGKDMFHDRIIDDLSMLAIDATTAENQESNLVSDTIDLKNETGPYTNLYSGQAGEAFGLFGNSIDTCNIAANIIGSNCYHRSCVEGDTKGSVLIMRLILIVTFIWLRMNLSGQMV